MISSKTELGSDMDINSQKQDRIGQLRKHYPIISVLKWKHQRWINYNCDCNWVLNDIFL